MSEPETLAPNTAPAVHRRRLLATVAAGAAAAGAGLGWWRYGIDASESPESVELWSHRFDRPDGGELAMASLRGRPLLVNFWATWCPPCVEELPLLDDFYKKNSANRWQVVGLAIDQPSAVRAFLSRTPVSFPVGLAGLEGTQLGKAMGNRSGGLPFSVVLSADGAVLQRRMGRVSQTDLAQWAQLS